MEKIGLCPRIRQALACEQCRRWRHAALLAIGALVLVWMMDRLATG